MCRLQRSPRQAIQRQEDQVQKSTATIQVILVEFYLDENFDDNLDDNVDDNLDNNLGYRLDDNLDEHFGEKYCRGRLR